MKNHVIGISEGKSRYRHPKLIIRTITMVLGMAIISPVSGAENQLQVAWQNAPSLPYRVQEIYPTVFEDHIVVAGGLSPDVDENRIGVSDRLVVYSLKTRTWAEGPALPERRHHPMLVAVSKRLLSFGGFTVDEEGAWHNSVDVLELVAADGAEKQGLLQHGRWKKIAQLPAPLAETLSAVHNGVVHLVTGRTPKENGKNSQWNDQSDVSTHYLFDLKTLTWSRGAPAPTARNSACGVKAQDKWHTIAGRTVSGGNLPTHEAYDFASGTWQTLAPLPQGQGGLACAASGDRIYVFGGEFFNNGGGVYPQVWEYTLPTDTWREVSQMPNPRHGLGALNVDGKIHVIGGASQAGGNQTSDSMSVYSPEALEQD